MPSDPFVPIEIWDAWGFVAHFQYLLLLLGCVVATVPLEFIYGFRVWRNPKRLLRSVVPGFVLFVCWDLVAVHRRHWWFSDRFTTGWTFPGGLPLEELAFFLIIPTAGISGYEAVRASLERRKSARA